MADGPTRAPSRAFAAGWSAPSWPSRCWPRSTNCCGDSGYQGAQKRQFGHVKARYRGLKKNAQQLHTLFALSNLWMVRHRLMG